MQRVFLLTIGLLVAVLATAAKGFQEPVSMDTTLLQEGDLLFVASARPNAITDVTCGFGGRMVSHVAIVHRAASGIEILEAVHRGVTLTPIRAWLAADGQRNSDCRHVYVGRLCHRKGVEASVQRALRYVGRPYDFYFDPGDSALYCSELVQLCYKRPSGRLVFTPIGMSFHNSKGHITDFWKQYYARVGRQVPEGAPGSNPGQLSRSRRLRIVGKLL